MIEEIVALGRDGAMCGVVTPAIGPREAQWGFVLLNAGLVHRVGHNRLHVRLARSLAPLGFVTLRFDFSGVGDSPARMDNPFFERRAVEEVLQAMDWLSQQHGCRRFALLGLCSGAEVAFKTACQDARVAAAVLINPQGYQAEPSRELSERVASAQKADYYWRVARFDRRRWLRLLSARVDFRAIGRAVAYKLRQSLRGFAREPSVKHPDVSAFADLLRRDIRLLLLFSSERDWGFHYLEAMFGTRIEQWQASGNLRLEIVGRSDHTLTPVLAQQRAIQLILDWARQLDSGACSEAVAEHAGVV